jgi:hypothetical protein
MRIDFRDANTGRILYTTYGMDEKDCFDQVDKGGFNYKLPYVFYSLSEEKPLEPMLDGEIWNLASFLEEHKMPIGYISPEDARFMREVNKNARESTANVPSREELYEELCNSISTEKENTQESERGIRLDQGKPMMQLLSPIAMMGTAQVLTWGCNKYGPGNWKKGMAWGKVIGSLLRHTFKFMAGEDFDEETKLPHVDHIATNAMFLQEYFRKHKGLDDRMKTGLE